VAADDHHDSGQGALLCRNLCPEAEPLGPGWHADADPGHSRALGTPEGGVAERGRGGNGEELSQATLERAFQQLSLRFDEQNGGFGNAPKFPMPHNLLFLLRYWKRTAGDRALQMVEQTLLSMRRGGVFDHVGLGFHRYSTDDHWLLPHFEKMLYDQAMLAMAYAEAYQATGKDAYRQTAEEIFAYVLRDMTAPEGGFYSAEDADSEGVEGKFYVWTQSELRRVLGEEDAKLVAKVFGVEAGGNYVDEATREKTGNNILHLEEPLSQLALAMGVTEQEIEQRIEAARGKLFAYREQRVHPLKDDKVLTDWNGLMIAALAKGARAFDAPRYADAAAAAASFILERMVTKDRRLLHRYRDGEAALPAYAADYAFLTWGLLELYEATFEVRFLEQALALNADMIAHFWDGARGGFYSTADDSEELLVRQKEIYDGAIPSANSVAMLNLLRLGRMTAAPDLEEKAAMIGRAFSRNVASSPAANTQLMVAVDFGLGPSYEVVVAGEPGAEDVSAMLGALRAGFIPSKVVLFRPDGESPAISRLADFTRYQASVDGKATAYVCRSHNCEFPTTDADAMLDLLGVSKR